MSSTDAVSSTSSRRSEQEGPIWDPIQQIYVGGQVPESAEVQSMIQKQDGLLRVFGYGSLCWKPGGLLAHPSVTSKLGKAIGYRRCWAQKSTDHRGEPRFPGIVCTLLKDEEVGQIRSSEFEENSVKQTQTEGVIYVVPPELVDECLNELDFREKGGYARDVIEVIEDETGRIVEALLYRGTPNDPAFWKRVFRDLPYAAAVISTAKGPSGKNDEYLRNLNQFLKTTTDMTTSKQFDDTVELSSMVDYIQSSCQVFFLHGAGSNQHNQLLLNTPNNAADLVNGEDAHEMKEVLLCVPKYDEDNASSTDLPQRVVAGGGHTAVITTSGRVYLFGWNERGQCGPIVSRLSGTPISMISALDGIRVEKCALGHNHTLFIEKKTGHLWTLGDNSRGQVTGDKRNDYIINPTKPKFTENENIIDISCGLFHSAAVTKKGEVIVFGCGRFGQSLTNIQSNEVWQGRWKPPDADLLKVACGRRHTIVLDNKGRLFSFGDNKYGQLGRQLHSDLKQDNVPNQVRGPWENDGYIIRDVKCGWSHCVVLATKSAVEEEDCMVEFTAVYAWGRNDKGQLGIEDQHPVSKPIQIFNEHPITIRQIECGSEFTMIINSNDEIWGCGWNEHGNVGQNHDRNVLSLSRVQGGAITNPPSIWNNNSKLDLSAGGGHIVTMRVHG